MIAKIDEAVIETHKTEKMGRPISKDEEKPKYVTLQALRKVLPTDAWSPLMDAGSTLSQTLLSEYFKNPREGQTASQIDVQYLKMFAMWHCVVGKTNGMMDRAKVLYGLLQEGGLDAHKFISATDKDMIPIFKKLC